MYLHEQISYQLLFDDPRARDKLSFCQGICILTLFKYLSLSVETTLDMPLPQRLQVAFSCSGSSLSFALIICVLQRLLWKFLDICNSNLDIYIES